MEEKLKSSGDAIQSLNGQIVGKHTSLSKPRPPVLHESYLGRASVATSFLSAKCVAPADRAATTSGCE